MKNFLMATFQGKNENKTLNNIPKDIKTKSIDAQKINLNNKNSTSNKKINNNKKNITNINKVAQKPKPKLSQEIMKSSLALIGQLPKTQNLIEEKKEKNIINNKDNNISNNAKTDNINNLNKNSKLQNDKKLTIEKLDKKDKDKSVKKYKEPYKPIGQYVIDKNLRFEENKSKKMDKNNKKATSNSKNNSNIKKINKTNNDEFNSDEEDELIKSKRKKINSALNLSKKKKSANKIRQDRSLIKETIKSLINDEEDNSKDKKTDKERKTKSDSKPKTISGNFVRLNLKKKYQEKKRVRPVKLRKIALNRSKELYKYQKKTIKNISGNDPYMGAGHTGLEDMETLMKEQNEVDNNDKNNLLNTLVEKLPVFSQSFIEETQKTPLKPSNVNNKDKNDNGNENNNEKGDMNTNVVEKINKTPVTNRLTTVLKNSLKKKVSLDTELKFLSQEFKYLLSGNKEKINKLNEIKKETLLSKKSLETINEENNNKINIDENANVFENNDNTEINADNQMSQEEIENMENEILITALKENFKYEQFNSELQLKTIKHILNKNNIFYISNPGLHQNLCYEFPSLLFDGITIVISPLLPNITQNITSLPTCLKAAAITSFTTASQKKEIYAAIKSNILNILYITPERFVLEKLEELKSFNISLICIEEASYGIPNSSNFRPFYINLIMKIKTLMNYNNYNENNNMIDKHISLLLLSNYITNDEKSKICELFEVENIIEEPLVIEPEINLCISKENNIKLSSLLKLVRTIPSNKNIFSVIFCNYKKTINEVTTFLNQNGINATSYHGGKDEIERQIIQSNFIKNKIKYLVCTSSYSQCFIQHFVKYIIIYEIPFSIEQLLNEINKSDGIKTQKYVHIFLDDNNYLNQRKLIFADKLERKNILTFIDYIFNDNSTNSKINNNANKFKKKRNYIESIEGKTTIDISNPTHGNNNINKIKCLNLNNIEDIYNIKRNFALYFLISLSRYKPKDNDNDNNNDALSDTLDVLGIGPSEITIRFFKTSPEVLSEKEPLLKTILSNCKERLGGYTFNVSNICNISSINYNDILLFLYKLQEQKEISYETKDDGIFIKLKKNLDNNLNKNILTYFYDLNNNLITDKIQKLNCVYILMRKYSVNNSSIFHGMDSTKLTQIKCLEFCGNYDCYKEEINKKIYSYFNLCNDKSESNHVDDTYAGNTTEKDILLPVVKLENQRDRINFIKNLKELIRSFLKFEVNINVIDVLFVLFGYVQKGKGIRNYMSHSMWNKYSNYDFEQLFDIVDTELKNIKIELINEDNKQLGSKKLK